MRLNGNYSSIEQITGQYLNNQSQPIKNDNSELSFEKIFKEKAQGLKFSKHAGERMESRNINLTDNQIKRLEEGTARAEKKGINESLMIMDNMAFIVNVKNNTVITAMDQTESKNNVYTNIDGAVIV